VRGSQWREKQQQAVYGSQGGLITDAPPLSMIGTLFLAPRTPTPVFHPQGEPRPPADFPALARAAEFHLEAMFAVSNVLREAPVPQDAPPGAIELTPIAESRQARRNIAEPPIFYTLQRRAREIDRYKAGTEAAADDLN